jgi:hypothetical protein
MRGLSRHGEAVRARLSRSASSSGVIFRGFAIFLLAALRCQR